MLYLKELMARDSSPLTPRSYGMDLLRWFRFLWVLGIEWDRATREDARDFMLWMKLADKPVRVHWRHRGKAASEVPPPRSDRPVPGTLNPVTGKPTVGTKYSPRTRAHCETVLRQFYDFHLDGNVGALLVNPFPLVRERRSARPGSHSDGEKKHRNRRSGLYRPTVPQQIPRRIPDEKYTDAFTGLRSHRDRALLAFWVATGARAEELLSATQGGAVVGEQTIGVIRKGSREYQNLPATPDAFVWLRLYQEPADATPASRSHEWLSASAVCSVDPPGTRRDSAGLRIGGQRRRTPHLPAP
ncbi:site-specific integrase [Streptomyces hirsutus]|uniref:site-specific integrase n=1 Tax=Streptomyces hirsutus TaxID=35620 RepID=UPI00366724CA